VEDGISNADIGLFKEFMKYIGHLTEQDELDINIDPNFSNK
jgi:hypothetical protein